ncbi:FAS1 domain-containing protein [Ephemerocybe angulata]|uniref:FAS1 domain-containing protein n=1 Tax=Ephemerocybe angulata TaxID=980116 RepID=A0A8H6M3Q4_9AGAR|nr:FAS1 domain-containing protein [Tulosesus angulatus]
MHFLNSLPISVILSLIPFVPLTKAQTNDNSTSNTFFQEFSTFLNDSGYTSFSSALAQANQTQSGQQLLSQLSERNRNWTLFAPTNQAFSSVPGNVSGNQTLLSEYLSYHFIHGDLRNATAGGNSTGGGGGGGSSSTMTSSASQSTSGGAGASSTTTGSAGSSSGGAGTSTTTSESPYSSAGQTPPQFSTNGAGGPGSRDAYRSGGGSGDSADGGQLESAVYPNVTIGRSLLNSSDLVQLEGNKSQVLAWTRNGSDGNVTILNQINNITVSNSSQWRNFFVAEVDGVFTPPGDVSTALTAVNDTQLLSFAQQVQVPLQDGSNGTVVAFLEQARGFTLFAPGSQAFTSGVNATIQQLQNNQSAAIAFFQNHYVNGSTIYSPTLTSLAVNASSGSSNQTIFSAGGEPFTFSFNDTGLFVNNGNGSSARVIRPDVLVENGVIHLIDTVLFNTGSEPSAASSAFESASAAATETSTDSQAIGVFPIPAPTSTSGGGSAGGGSSSSTTSSSSSSSSEQSQSQSQSMTSSSSSASQSQSSTASGGGGGGSSSSATPSSFRARRDLGL